MPDENDVYEILGSKDHKMEVKCRKCGTISIVDRMSAVKSACCDKCGVEFEDLVLPPPLIDPARGSFPFG